MFVLDTNTISYAMRAEGGVHRRLAMLAPADVGIPTVVAFELLTGVERSRAPGRRRDQVERLLATVVPLPFGVDEARSAARIRADLEARGMPIGPLDVLIAGTALARGATLVTRNVGEFARVPGLRVESWYEEP